MHIGSYKELKVWGRAIELVDLVYELTKEFPKAEEFGLKSQMRRSAVSIPSNIAEGSQRNSDKEFLRFIHIAKGSLVELETQIIISQHQQFVLDDKCDALFIRISELQKMLYSFSTKLKANI
tara:strand:- start:704 stop:1069 length:366 start_codon:yes stop_codon:yes gene_type:complete